LRKEKQDLAKRGRKLKWHDGWPVGLKGRGNFWKKKERRVDALSSLEPTLLGKRKTLRQGGAFILKIEGDAMLKGRVRRGVHIYGKRRGEKTYCKSSQKGGRKRKSRGHGIKKSRALGGHDLIGVKRGGGKKKPSLKKGGEKGPIPTDKKGGVPLIYAREKGRETII